MDDILTTDMKRVFEDCNKEGLSRVLIYLDEFKNSNTTHKASFKRDDISIMNVWVESQKAEQRKKDKFQERIWNLIFLLVGAAISALVAWGTTKTQLAVAVDPVVEIIPSDNVIGKEGNFELFIRNIGLSDLYDIRIYEDYFVTETLDDGDIQLISVGPLLTQPNIKINELEKDTEKKFIMDSKLVLKQMNEFYHKRESLQMEFVRLTIQYRRKADGKGFKKTKAYIIDLSGNVLMDHQTRGINTPYALSFDDIKKILGVESE